MQAGAATLVALGRRYVRCFAGRRNGRAWLGHKLHVAVLAVCMCPDARPYVLVHMVAVCVCCVHGSCCVCVAKCWEWAEHRPLPGNPHMRMLFVAPKPCGAVRIAAYRNRAVADRQPNRAKFEVTMNCRLQVLFALARELPGAVLFYYVYVDCS